MRADPAARTNARPFPYRPVEKIAMSNTDRHEKQNHSLPESAVPCKPHDVDPDDLRGGAGCLHDAPLRCTRCHTVVTEVRPASLCRGPRAKPGCCTPPSEQPTVRNGEEGRIVTQYPRGRLGGECRPFIDHDTGEVHWIDVLIIADGAQERPIPAETFLHQVHAAAFLGVRRSTLYAWTPYLESAEKRGSRLIFYSAELVNTDMPELENRLPRRRDIQYVRRKRAAGGEWLRRGRHVADCPREHDGKCGADRPRPHEREKR